MLALSRRCFVALVLLAGLAMASPPVRADEPNDQELLENLTQLKGRLEAARELVRLGKGDFAVERHLGKNLGGRYARIAPELQARKLPGFEADLDKIVADAKSSARFDPAVEKIIAKIDAVENSIPADKLKSPKFLAAVLVALVEHSAIDYEAAIADGKIKIIKEFEEVYGYDRATVALWNKRLKPAIGEKASSELASAFAKLEKAVPSPVAPAKIEVTPAAFNEIVATIKAEAAKL
jgi:hypothetical protein